MRMQDRVESPNTISSMQTMLLIVFTILPTAILFVPGITSSFSKNDAWMSTLLAGFVGLLVAWLCAALTSRYPGETVIQFSGKIVGKWGGLAVGWMFSLYFLYVAYFVLREFNDFMNTFVLPETPSIFIVGSFTILAAHGIYKGLDVLARSNSVIGLICLAALGIVMLIMINDMKWAELLPIFGKNTTGSIVMGSFAPSCWISECAIIMMFAPYMNKPEQAMRMNMLAIAVILVTLTLFVIGGLTIFGYDILSRLHFPLFHVVKYARPAEFLERIDPVFIAVWIAGMIMKFSIYYYSGVLGLAQTLQLPNYRSLVLPTGMLLVALSLISWNNIAELKQFSSDVFPPSVLFVTVGVTLLLAVGMWCRRLFGDKKAGARQP